MIDILQSTIDATSDKSLRWNRGDGELCIFTAHDNIGRSYLLKELENGDRMFEYTDPDGTLLTCSAMSGEKVGMLIETIKKEIVSLYPYLVKPVNLSVSLQKIKERLRARMQVG